MVRPLLPKQAPGRGDTPSSPEAEPEARGTKRRCVSSACIPCRKRKSKCNGETPSCASCLNVYQSECTYDVDSDHRRKKPAKRRRTTRQDKSRALQIIAASISAGTEAEAMDILLQVHRGEDSLDTIAETVQQNTALPARSDSQPLGDLADFMGKPTRDHSGETRQYGHTSGLGLISEGLALEPQQQLTVDSWTTVTEDADFITHLIQLFFCWIHPFYVVLSEECLRHDMSTGRNKYCSPLLINAILACACGYSDRPEARTDPNDPTTAGDHFFAEARRLLNEDDRTCLTTTQALAIMSLREASCARDSSGFQYIGRSIRMVLEMGMHLSYNAQETEGLTPVEIEVRKITAWGCFVLDTLWAICVGRIAQLPRTAINLEPIIKPAWDEKPWRAYPEPDNPPAEAPQGPHPYTMLQYLSSLSEIVNETVAMFYSPRERFTTSKFLEFNQRYNQWYKSLPPHLHLANNKTPHVIALHMYYHTLVLHLFRPFLKISSMDSNVPRRKCTEAANAISDLFEVYRSHYGLRRSFVLFGHVALSTSQIHLLNSPNPTANKYFTECVRNFCEMGANHPFALRCLRIIISVAAEWGTKLPAEAKRLAAMHVYSPLPSVSPPVSQSFPNQQSQDAVTDLIPMQRPNESQPPPDVPEFFWSPFAHQSNPLQVSTDMVSTDFETMLSNNSNEWDQFGHDRYEMVNQNVPNLSPPRQQYWTQP